MKNKSLRKSKKNPAKNAVPTVEKAQVIETPIVVQNPPPVVTLSPPPPEVLEQWAEEEPNLIDLSAYFGAMRTLRGKGFSYREIAEWLQQHGVEVDHNSVYRVYMRNLSDYEAHMQEKEDDQEAQDEAMRNR